MDQDGKVGGNASYSDATKRLQRVAAIRDEWIAIHDETYGQSWWKSLRRVLPIPGVFQAIPFGAQSKALNSLLIELDNIRDEAANVCESAVTEHETRKLSAATVIYCEQLRLVIAILHKIQHTKADNIERRVTEYTLSDYNRDVDAYEKARSTFQMAVVEIKRVLESDRS